MINIEHISLVANLGALSVIGILYTAYIKNLRSQLDLKNEQLNTSEQNIKLWRDKALELERKTPQYVEQILAKRINIREEEIARLAEDEEGHRTELDQKNKELDQLKRELETAHEFGRGISIYDPNTQDYRQLSISELKVKDLGEVWVDTATLMICDPWHLGMSREREIEEYPVFQHLLKDKETGEIFYAESEDQRIFVGEGETSTQKTVKELVALGSLEHLPVPKELPAYPDSYIKGDKLSFVKGDEVKAATFYNGISGAGLSIGTHGDGSYMVRGEFYKGEIRRIFIDIY